MRDIFFLLLGILLFTVGLFSIIMLFFEEQYRQWYLTFIPFFFLPIVLSGSYLLAGAMLLYAAITQRKPEEFIDYLDKKVRVRQ